MGTVKESNILVSGDVFVDHHVYEGERLIASASKHRGLRVIREHGGAVGLNRLIKAVLEQAVESDRAKKEEAVASAEKRLAQAAAKTDGKMAAAASKALKEAKENLNKPIAEAKWDSRFALTTPDLNSVPCGHHAVAVWKPFPKDSDEKCKEQVWRAGMLMGYGHDDASSPTENESCPVHCPRPLDELPVAKILVLDDAGFIFRHRELEKCWLLDSSGQKADWIVMKMSGPVCAGDLWDRLTKDQQKRLIVVVSAHELRQECVRLGAGLSWEQAVEELRDAFRDSPLLKNLAEASSHLVVTFSTDGALWLDNSEARIKATLVFDAAAVEGAWARNIKGEAFGYLSCMVASLVRGLARDPESPAFAPAISSGLMAMRDLLKLGHGPVSDKATNGFPIGRIAGVIEEEKTDFSVIRIPWTEEEWKPYAMKHLNNTNPRPWHILECSQCAFGSDQLPSLIGLATQVVLQGEAAIKRLPHARFGKLLTADRFEIESLHNIERQMLNYKMLHKAARPLSLGVFGPPGAGKSFGVKQIAGAIFGEKAWAEFNLSQFKDEDDLIGALHRVRDLVLSGVTPVVFWDEFDSREYFWLQYLLAPMQDGRFQEGQINHYVGKCVFIFAGATSFTFAEFGPEKPGAKNYDEKAWKTFKLRKGPDFHSRLDAYLDVLGPNQRTLPADGSQIQQRAPDKLDVCAPLRRGLLIRALLDVPKNARLDFDADLLNALLSVPNFTHGSRSVEKLISSLKPSSPDQPIRRSSLPPASVMTMHIGKSAIEEQRFETMLNQNNSFRNAVVIAPLAKAIHEAWLPYAAPDNPLKKPWEELPDSCKEDNFAAARRIPEVLALAGLQIQTEKDKAIPHANASAEEKAVVDHLKHHLERLAEAEHDRWMHHRLTNGWRYNAARDDTKKLHPLLKAYAELPNEEKRKDREAILNYPEHVAKAGYRIVFA